VRILIVEDELRLAEALTQILERNSYTVDAVCDGISGYDYSLSGIYDLIILDILLPEMDGITVLKNMRKEGISTPVILLTALGEIDDRVNGLDCGADDYLAKPFAIEELLARIRAALRRKDKTICDEKYKYGDIELDPRNHRLQKNERSIKLILKEYELLEFLLVRKNSVTSKELIIEKLWGYDSDIDYNNVEVYISFLRKKLVFLNSAVMISTIRGRGYVLEVDSACLES
jgi:two-component system response regulator ArlR